MLFHWLKQVVQNCFLISDESDSIPAGIVGEWQSENGYRLFIENDGTGSYEKINFLVRQYPVKSSGRIRMIGNALIVRTSLRQRYLAIDKFPFREGLRLKMVLNGIVFTRIG